MPPSMIRLRRPTDSDLLQIADDQAGEELTYGEAGATANPDLPEGYAHDRLSTVLGYEDDVFRAGVRALRDWGPQRGSGLSVVATGPVVPGTTVAQAAPLGLAYAMACCRVVYVEEHADLFAYAYGTLPMHPEQGEERFAVTRIDGRVEFEVVAFSKLRYPLARLGAPVARRLQLRALHRYLVAMQRAAAAPPPAPSKSSK